VDVTRTRKNTETPALLELRRLGISIGKPGQQITVDGKTYALAPEEYRALLKNVGPETERLLNAALASPGYRKDRETPARTDLTRGKMLSDAISQARRRFQSELASQIYRAEQNGATHAGTVRAKRPKF
jgi:5-keto 4-deoxyuronate isomerase